MQNIVQIVRRVATESVPPAELGRLHYGDYDQEILLDDLVSTRSWLDLDLKERFLALWVTDPAFMDPAQNLDDPFYERTRGNLRKFAAMIPIVNLDSLRGRDPLNW